jgi:acyl-CoA reductase-like NAD-dependent aldehyde dehydrogenase
MSELTPKTSELFATLIAQYFSIDQVTVINGGVEVAREFASLPFDHLLFTGSTSVGKQVMRAAAENLTPVTLELGGKSPAIIGPECNIDEAAEKIMFGKCLNAGQTCIAPDYVLLPRAREQAFATAAQRVVASLYPTLARNNDYTSIVNTRHFGRLQSFLDDAAARGATVLPIMPANESLDGTGKIAPTLVANVTDEMRLMQDEIFGPILPLVPYDNLDEAIRYVNARPRPLALYYFGNFDDHIQQVLNETIAGGVTVNDTLLHISQDNLPFGGVGPSGMGAYHGKCGFETFSKLKPIFHQSPVNGLGLFKPPYGKRFDTLIKLLMR